ncbi:ribonuclease T1 [Streptomyces canus]|uniref:Ribonuclease T1 n=2 Tax=Streptomyces canus TaxID=58343 RepID=A0AAW8FT06_9ACTN|nr:ribonuclease T1 [Streptomyces canus]
MRGRRGSIERMLLRFVSRVLLCVLVLAGCSATDSDPARGGLATVQESKLPAEARQTLELVDRGGPFPYAKDGSVFGNFERLLPAHQRGYYHEYTVPTPGSRDRGARRIVTGQGGEIYYTDDHYDSFRAVLR